MLLNVKKNQGKSWVINSNQIAYFKPAYALETVMIKTKLIHFTEKGLVVEMKMLNESETNLKAIIWSKFTYCDIVNGESSIHSENLMGLFQSIVLPVEQSLFEQRCKAIIQKLKSD